MNKAAILSIIIPTYNEEKTITEVIERVWNTPLEKNVKKEIIVVDDASADLTAQKVDEYLQNHPDQNILFIKKTKNEGKGAAIREGIRLATGDWIIIQDADKEYNPEDYNVLLKPALDGYADVVYGSRFMGGKPHRILFFWHSIGNKFLTQVSNAFTDLNLTDMETGYKLFRADILKSIRLEENRFGFEPEVTAKIARIPGIRIYEVGIGYYGRTYEEGKKIKAKDGFRALYTIFKYNIQHIGPRRPVAGFLTLALMMVFGYKLYFDFREKTPNFIKNDAAEYYQYLPAAFIYHDLGFRFLDTLPDLRQRMSVFPSEKTGKAFGLRTLGMAIVNAPAFLIAHLYATIFDVNDGYSPPYHWAILITSFIFLGLGIYYLQKTLLLYYNPLVTSITTILLVLATNILAYITIYPAMTHIINFGMVSMLVYFIDKFYGKISLSLIWKIAILLGFLSLIRPSNALLILLFFLWGCRTWKSMKKRLSFLLRNYHYVLIISGGVLIVWLPHLIYWKWAAGSFWFYTYGIKGERFFWNNPQIINVLLSYRNGLLVYSPLMFFTMAGFIFLWKQKNRNALAITFVSLGLLYILSSWWCWYYGGSFGGRSFIDIYPLLAFPLAAFIYHTHRYPIGIKLFLVVIAALLIHLNYYQTWQHSKGIIHWSGMTKEAYWKSIREKWPSEDYYKLIWEPNAVEEKKGIYFQNDINYWGKNHSQKLEMTEREFIDKLKLNIKANQQWYHLIKEKARNRNISEDSMLTLDAYYIFEVRYNNKVPENK